MSTDYGEKERQFIETLEADTGRSLDAWMAAINAAGLEHRNDIIDWLRRQGFLFSKASWLERIHNNSGKPIYGETGNRRRAEARPATPRLRIVATTPAPPPQPLPTVTPPRQPSAEPQPPAPAPPPRPQPSAEAKLAAPSATDADAASIEALLGRAKAYRPLAVYLVAEIRKAVPDAATVIAGTTLVFRNNGRDFAHLAVSPKELRLALALDAPPPAGAGLEPAKPAGRGGITTPHYAAALTDARQIGPALLAAVTAAAASRA